MKTEVNLCSDQMVILTSVQTETNESSVYKALSLIIRGVVG